MEVIAKVVSTVMPFCIMPVWHIVTYPLNPTENLKALKVAVDGLFTKEAHLKANVEIAQLQGLRQTNLVEKWFRQVETVKREFCHIIIRYEERSPCLGSRSLNFWFNYWISADAADMLKEVDKLLKESNFEEVAVPLPRVQEFQIANGVLLSKEADHQTIVRYIDNGDDGDDIIGIWGMGGVGKTRLLKLVHNHYVRSSTFDTVIFVTASRDCSVGKVQAELCEKYGIGQGNSIASQAIIISNYLSTKNFLLLLDEVWDRIDLESVGIPFRQDRVNQFKRKVVITTRSKIVCYSMDVKEKRMLMVSCLDKNNALHLFLENVGDETFKNDPEKHSLAQRVVHELDGLPLALVTVGRAMRAKKLPRQWVNAINLLRSSSLHEIETTNDQENKIYQRLKFSYDSLKTKELKDCFLACSLFPENYPIENDKLIEVWCGLGIFDQRPCHDDIYDAGHDLISELLLACLLEQDGSHKVKMHNVIRDMALWIACGEGQNKEKWIVQVGVGVDKVLLRADSWSRAERATLLNPCKTRESIPHQAENLCFLKVLSHRFGVEHLIGNLKYFKFLTFLDLSNCNIENFPKDSTNLLALRYFNLSNNKIKSVPEQLGDLTRIEYLLLRNNKIGSFPTGVISNLKKLRILDLYEICGWERTDYMTNLIMELKNLYNPYYLGITLHSVAQWEGLLYEVSRSYVNVRALSVYICEEINSFTIPPSFFCDNTEGKLSELSFGKMSVKKIVVQNSVSESSRGMNHHCEFRNLEQLIFDQMGLLGEIIWEGSTVSLFPRLHTLRISRCGRLRDISWAYYLPSLRRLHLIECDSMVQLIQGEREGLCKVFSSLTHLILINLPHLELISEEPIMFPSLEYICTMDCPMLKRKLPFNSDMFPDKLTTIKGGREWWEQLEWEGDSHLRMRLQPLFEEI